MAQVPASGAAVVAAIAQALRVAEAFAKQERLRSALPSEDCRLWIELLEQSQDGLSQDSAPAILRGDLSTPLGVILDLRRWIRFQRWFERHMVGPLKRAARESGVPELYGGRISDRRGGRAEYSEAHYFVSFQRPGELLSDDSAAGRSQGHGTFASGSKEILNGELGPAYDKASLHEGSERQIDIPMVPSLDSEGRLRERICQLESLTSQLKRLLAERVVEIDNLMSRSPPP